VENILRSTFHPQDQSNISAEGLAAQMEGLGLGGINSTTPANPRSRRHSESRNTRPRFEQSFVAEERPRESFWNPFQRPQRSQSHRRSQSANRPTPATAHTPSASTTRYRQADPLTEREGNNPNRIHEGSSREEILFGPETLRDFEQFYRDYDNRVPFEASGIVYMQTPYATGLFDHTTGKSHHLYHPAKAVKHSPSLEHIFVLTPEEGIETLIR
jgi:hypothetical protein